jgi:hypothetical protein
MSIFEQVRQLMYSTISDLKKLGISEEEATDQVIGIIKINSENINNVDYMRILLNGLVEINKLEK